MPSRGAVRSFPPGLRARALFLALVACTPLLSGYVFPPIQVLKRWFRDVPRFVAPLPVRVPVRVQGRAGHLYLDRRGDHALAVEGTARPVAEALWRSLDLLLAPDPEAAAAGLEAAGVDLGRAGYARDTCSEDGVVHTLGARGEGEPDTDQVWFARVPLRPCRVVVAGAAVEVGPPGVGGLPAWFRLATGELLELVGEPVPAVARPAWAVPVPVPLGSSPDAPLGDWRRAFGPAAP